jgi:hypothetical protein
MEWGVYDYSAESADQARALRFHPLVVAAFRDGLFDAATLAHKHAHNHRKGKGRRVKKRNVQTGATLGNKNKIKIKKEKVVFSKALVSANPQAK